LGYNTTASGYESFAAGYRARATNDNCFVWADFAGSSDFGSTGVNQFLVRAGGGVGINTNNPSGAALNVLGTVRATSFQGDGSGLTGLSGASITAGTLADTRLSGNVALLNASQTFTGSETFTGPVTLSGTVQGHAPVFMNGNDLLVSQDQFHGLGWYGSGRLFAGNNVNGPVLYGFDGGALGVKNGTDQLVLRWNSAGRVGINTFSPNYTLHVNGTAYCTSGAWSGSDARWKQNIQPLQGALAKILQLQGVSYEWRRQEFPDRGFEPGFQLGFIAQQVEPILPEVVHTDAEGYKAIAYEKLTPVLTEAIKEQQNQIEALTAQNAQLAASVAELKALVNTLVKQHKGAAQ
jgi:hypothetical protein